MKKNLPLISALAITVLISAFTIEPYAIRYAVLVTGSEFDKRNYTIVSSQPSHQFTNVFDIRLHWFKIDAGPDGVISDAEWDTAWETYDVASDASNFLSDESSDTSGEFDLFNK
jgi:hypothetical protein